eukprot:CCRYP_018723-RA/>CCRYP_018723-RA protein AED:0.47 eAED:0.47 QI:0/0/0/1/0/0/2/0/261
MITAKILFNSFIFTPSTRFMMLDISNFYLMTPLKRPEYLQVKLLDIPEEIICEYNLASLADPDGSVYILVLLGMYGLPQAGLLANELLKKCLNAQGYFQSKLFPSFWRHTQCPIQFSLVVDDFDIKYTCCEHANHLLTFLQEHYTITADWTGNRYISITLTWDYTKRQVHLSMPGYVAKALNQFHHPKPTTPQHHANKIWRQETICQTTDHITSTQQTRETFHPIVCGKFLFLGQAVNPTLLCPISAIASQSAQPTEDTMT